MRRTWLAGALVTAAAVGIPATALTGTAHAATISSQQKAVTASAPRTLVHQAPAAKQTFNTVAASLAQTLVGGRYAYGGTTPAGGFDCSGLTQWVYKHTGGGKPIQRTSQAQYVQFKRIAKSAAKPGDLVFFHDTTDLSSYVYHVGVYEGGNNMVAATTPSGGVKLQSFTWAGNTVTFGTITH
jgi:cell wall-associated NlpC family hydrolase